ncbi:MAG TPA: ThiF family adenylyltransferase [Chloroflexota bacterium]|jgi:hypothetical protein
MSSEPISRSPDLIRLRDKGYDIAVIAGHLLVRQVPYVASAERIAYGTIVSRLEMAGDITTRPGDHVVFFAGETPCDRHGVPLAKVINSSGRQELGSGVVIDHVFSSKPPSGYADYYEKMTAYVRILSHEAMAVDPSVTSTPFTVLPTGDTESPFVYVDTASSRAGIAAVNSRLELGRIAIVGLGGTGSYILDLVAKTPVRQIDLFDGDKLLQHNAFRAPGAISLEQLKKSPYKVDYFASVYGQMHRGIVSHPYFIDGSTVSELAGVEFAFLAMDAGPGKAAAIDALDMSPTPFVDVGMGLYEVDSAIAGQLRVVTSLPAQRSRARRRIPIENVDAANEYGRNIQIADLNALNAALAVIRWKKLFGFYLDLEHEQFTAYQTNGNCLINEDF